MLLVVDIGNTNIVLGVYDELQLRYHWRLQTVRERTADEWWIYVKSLLSDASLDPSVIGGIAISSVVPPLTPVIQHMFSNHFGCKVFAVTPDTDTGMPIDYDSPRDVGADRIVNAVAAINEYGAPTIIIDFGTATTFCVVNEEGRYQGGLIVPGIQISAQALFERAAKLPRVELTRPRTVIGHNTVEAMQAGAIFGYAGLVEGVVTRIKRELPLRYTVVATGGLAHLLGAETKAIDVVDPYLTLKGLRLLWSRHRKEGIGI